MDKMKDERVEISKSEYKGLVTSDAALAHLIVALETFIDQGELSYDGSSLSFNQTDINAFVKYNYRSYYFEKLKQLKREKENEGKSYE